MTHASPSTTGNTTPTAPTRVMSVDALRGFAMFWLIGGQAALLALVEYLQWPALRDYVTREFEHPPWDGFHWWDVVMPTFLFVSGMTIPLTVTRRLSRGDSRPLLYVRIFRRLCLLMLLNVMAYGALSTLDWHEMRFMGVLARIGLSYALAAIIVLHTTPRRQLAWGLGILIGYAAAMMLIPVPGVGRGLLTPEGSLAAFMDRNLLPGLIMGGMYDRLGLFSTLPTVSTVLLGALAGQWLFLESRDALAKLLWLLVAAVVCLDAGHVWARWFPINTKVWSPSYVLAAGGWSLIFLAVFYLFIDVWGLRRWAFVFVVIGMNSLAIYFAQYPINFDGIARFFLTGAMGRVGEPAAALILACGVLLIEWLVTFFLYRRRIFIRV